jgi:hypothetical protein
MSRLKIIVAVSFLQYLFLEVWGIVLAEERGHLNSQYHYPAQWFRRFVMTKE